MGTLGPKDTVTDGWEGFAWGWAGYDSTGTRMQLRRWGWNLAELPQLNCSVEMLNLLLWFKCKVGRSTISSFQEEVAATRQRLVDYFGCRPQLPAALPLGDEPAAQQPGASAAGQKEPRTSELWILTLKLSLNVVQTFLSLSECECKGVWGVCRESLSASLDQRSEHRQVCSVFTAVLSWYGWVGN